MDTDREKHLPVTGAAALTYDPERDEAPRIIARGRGVLAEKIIDEARKNGIPLIEDRMLFEILYQLEIGSEIPATIYEPVAKILTFIYTMYQKQNKKSGEF
ncbi:MAG: hypothetical protein GXO76_05120 [Calditrichaeota bacterium]|nr:hypothetical protein [Calditrichota bacterium]